jgi:hypothetical protein
MRLPDPIGGVHAAIGEHGHPDCLLHSRDAGEVHVAAVLGLARACVHGQPVDATGDRRVRDLDGVLRAHVVAEAHLHHQRQPGRAAHGAHDALDLIGLPHQCHAAAGLLCLLHRAAAVEVDQVRTLGLELLSGLRAQLGIAAVDLHRDGLLLGHRLGEHPEATVLQAVSRLHRRDHLAGDEAASPHLLGDQAERQVGETRHRRQRQVVLQAQVADLEGMDDRFAHGWSQEWPPGIEAGWRGGTV